MWDAATWTAFASVVNAIVVVVLAGINYRYMRSAARQADAAMSQASEAKGQTKAALENIRLIKDQMQDQALLKRIETLVDLRRMRSVLEWWSPKLAGSWGQLPPFDGFLPDNWTTIVFVVERALPVQKQNMIDIETRVINAELLLSTELAKDAGYRQPDEMKAASSGLNDALRPLREVLVALENPQIS